jgi:hypothetical protein
LKTTTLYWKGVYAFFPSGSSCKLKVVNDLAFFGYSTLNPALKHRAMDSFPKQASLSFLILTAMGLVAVSQLPIPTHPKYSKYLVISTKGRNLKSLTGYQ